MVNKTSNSNVEQSIDDVRRTVGRLAAANNSLAEEVVVLKKNYEQLVQDVNSRFKLVHENLFRKKS